MKRFFILLLLSHILIATKAQDLTILHLDKTTSGYERQVEYVDSVKCSDGKGNVLVLSSSEHTAAKADIIINAEQPYASANRARKKIGVVAGADAAVKYSAKLRDEGCELIVCLMDDGQLESVRDADIVMLTVSNTYGVSQLSVDYQHNRLTSLYKTLKDKNVFVPGGGWFPYPDYEDRDGWNALLGKHTDRLVKAGEKYLNYKWQSIDATAYLAYERTGERVVMETPQKQNRVALNTLLLAELAEGEGRFVDQLINGAWHIALLGCFLPIFQDREQDVLCQILRNSSLILHPVHWAHRWL